jgi:hypothetical protein
LCWRSKKKAEWQKVTGCLLFLNGQPSVEDLARALSEAGISGRRGSATDCPIARYIKQMTGLQRVCVGSGGVHFVLEESQSYVGVVEVPLIERFVVDFDGGWFPFLEQHESLPAKSEPRQRVLA